MIEQNMHHGQLNLIVSGTAGTGKSYLIQCVKNLLQDQVAIIAPTGVAAFNIQGCTIHSFLDIPTNSKI